MRTDKRFGKFVWNKFEQPKAGPQGVAHGCAE